MSRSLHGRQLRCILGTMRVCRQGSRGVNSFSKNVGRQVNVTLVLLRLPHVLMMSRPATKLSPHRHVHFHGLLIRLDGSHIIVFSARVVRSVSDSYGRIIMVGGNRLGCFNSPTSVIRVTGKGM